MSKKRKLWAYAVGERPNTVRVFERTAGGTLYVRVWDSEKGLWCKRSLGHTDTERAKAYAHEQHARLRAGRDDLRQGRVTLAHLFALYERHRTPRKSAGEQVEDARRIELWTRVLGADKDPHKISLAEWESFIARRESGAIDPRGHPVPEAAERRQVRSASGDCKWLRLALGWGTRWRTREGRYLLQHSAVRGFEVTSGQNPRRPVASRDRYEAARAVSDRVMTRVRRNGKRVAVRSYLSEVLDIAAGTGRRISPVCELRYMDLRLEGTPAAPYGAIVWPEETDKMSRTREAPVSPAVRAAIDRVIQERPGIGAAWLFPALADPSRPITRHLARDWMLTAEGLAGLEKQDGSLWHAYRRGWATERKWLPDVDVAAVGGWANVATLQACYQQADPATMLRVVMEPTELREVHG
jgi:hypothetical protein